MNVSAVPPITKTGAFALVGPKAEESTTTAPMSVLPSLYPIASGPPAETPYKPIAPFLTPGSSCPTWTSARIAALVEANASTNAAIRALVQVGQELPGVRKGPIGLYGVSAGGPEAIGYKDGSTDIGAVVVDSSAFGPTKANAPVLVIGGTADTFISVEAQQTYEQTLRNSGGTVESQYYEGGTHGVASGDLQEAVIKRMADFYLRYLK